MQWSQFKKQTHHTSKVRKYRLPKTQTDAETDRQDFTGLLLPGPSRGDSHSQEQTKTLKFSVTSCCADFICLHTNTLLPGRMWSGTHHIVSAASVSQALWFDPGANGVCLRSSRAVRDDVHTHAHTFSLPLVVPSLCYNRVRYTMNEWFQKDSTTVSQRWAFWLPRRKTPLGWTGVWIGVKLAARVRLKRLVGPDMLLKSVYS